jgi:tetratricopeptide (TPR) repeat protein
VPKFRAFALLDELIGEEPSLWSFEDRKFDPDLLARLERMLLERTLAKLASDSLNTLERYCVYRKAVKAKAFKEVSAGISDVPGKRRLLIDRFLVEHDRGWDRPHTVVREVVLCRLESRTQDRRGYHSLAADYYVRHFRARRITHTDELSGYFVEARFHLTRSGRESELAEISGHFLQHLAATLSQVSTVPSAVEELDERIILLQGLLRDGGPWSLQYNLARCLSARGKDEDLRDALDQIRRVCRKSDLDAAWILRLRLEDKVAGIGQLYRAITEGLTKVDVNRGGDAIYTVAAELLGRAGKVDEAVALLREGIERVPAEKSLFSLYQSAGELLGRAGKVDEAVALLREGIERVPAEKNLFSLYQSAGELLNRTGKVDEAVALLREGIRRIPRGFSRERVVEPVLYLCLVYGDAITLREIIEGAGLDAIDDHQRALGGIMLQQLAGEWREAAEMAKAERQRLPTYLHLLLQETFSWLCAGDATAAQESLDRYPNELRLDSRNSCSWISALVALECGDLVRANKALCAYLDVPCEMQAPPDKATLLRLWDDDAALHGPVPAYTYPTIPPSLTGLSGSITRKLDGGPVFASSESKTVDEEMTVKSKRSFLVVATEWASKHGGLSTFSRELCLAMVRQELRVSCLVPDATENERKSANEGGVVLVSAPTAPGLDEMSRLLLRPTLPADFQPDWIIGHDRVTGPAAKALAENHLGAALLKRRSATEKQ